MTAATLTDDLRPTDAGTRRFGRTVLIDLALVAVIWLSAIALTNPIGDFPLDDDWVYGLAVQSILHTGSFALPSPASANVVLQAYWGALFCLPFGFSFTALRLSTICLGLLGLFGGYGVVRELGAGRRIGLICALAIGFNPFYFALSDTFMTDTPFVALSTLGLWCFVRGMRREQGRWVAAAFGVALATVLIRQFAFVFLAGFCVAYWVRGRSSVKSVAVLVLVPAAGLAIHLLFQHWLLSSGHASLVPIGSVGDLRAESLNVGLLNVLEAARVIPYVGLIAAPVLALGLRPVRLTRPLAVRLATLAMLVVAEVFVMQFQFPVVHNGNILAYYGIGPLPLRDIAYARLNLPASNPALTGFWWILATTSLIAGAVMIESLIRSTAQLAAVALKPSQWPEQWLAALGVALTGALALLLVAVSIRFGLYDRYIMVMIPIALVIMAAAGGLFRQPLSRLGLAVSLGLLLAYGGFSLTGTRDFMEWNRNRWAATDVLERAQISPRRIDGGFEFNGYRLNDTGFVQVPGKSAWWVHDDEFVIASGPMPGYRIQQRFAFRRWLTGEPSQIVILERVRQP